MKGSIDKMAASYQLSTVAPRFGVSALILDAKGKLLVGQRFGSHGAGEKPSTEYGSGIHDY